jgi:hypothetical protein
MCSFPGSLVFPNAAHSAVFVVLSVIVLEEMRDSMGCACGRRLSCGHAFLANVYALGLFSPILSPFYPSTLAPLVSFCLTSDFHCSILHSQFSNPSNHHSQYWVLIFKISLIDSSSTSHKARRPRFAGMWHQAASMWHRIIMSLIPQEVQMMTSRWQKKAGKIFVSTLAECTVASKDIWSIYDQRNMKENLSIYQLRVWVLSLH